MKRTVQSSYGPVELETGPDREIIATFKPAPFLPAVTLAFSRAECNSLRNALFDLVMHAYTGDAT